LDVSAAEYIAHASFSERTLPAPRKHRRAIHR
jgi:hypothetical protein